MEILYLMNLWKAKQLTYSTQLQKSGNYYFNFLLQCEHTQHREMVSIGRRHNLPPNPPESESSPLILVTIHFQFRTYLFISHFWSGSARDSFSHHRRCWCSPDNPFPVISLLSFFLISCR